MDIVASVEAYEAWLRAQLKTEFVANDLKKKHKKMAKGAFPFLRATYWRWSETVLEKCPDLATAPAVLAVGDIHLENYGTWRDADGRLVWGVNDFDEAAEMPYAIDLVRLATSAALARENEIADPVPVCKAIIAGYSKGLEDPMPFVLDRDHKWLRALVEVKDAARDEFWTDLAELEEGAPLAHHVAALKAAMPDERITLTIRPRQAGTGSLGRPRFAACGEWRGAPVVRESKALVPSAWTLAPGREAQPIRTDEVATGPHRSPDPWYRRKDNIVVRRLSPNNRKIEVKDADDLAALVGADMLAAMGHELANIHLGNAAGGKAIAHDLVARNKLPNWLSAATQRMADAVIADCNAWRKHAEA